MKEERDIFIEAMSKIDSYFMKYIKPYEEENKKNIEEILYSILEIYYQLESIWINKKFEEYRKYSNITKFNIMAMGKTGVGKSCLINGVLNLKANKANEGKTEKPKYIEGWKKYPIEENDSDIKGLNIWETEGIVFSRKNKNDLENDLKKIKDIINNHIDIPHEQINCLWYCINGILEEKEYNYINSLIKMFRDDKNLLGFDSKIGNYKFPIIFVYTQAYMSVVDNIEFMEKRLKEFRYFNSKNQKELKDTNNSKELKDSYDSEVLQDFNNSGDFHFIEVIAKEKSYLNIVEKKK